MLSLAIFLTHVIFIGDRANGGLIHDLFATAQVFDTLIVTVAALDSSCMHLVVKICGFLVDLPIRTRVGLGTGSEGQIIVAIAIGVWKKRQLAFTADANGATLGH